MDNNEEKQITPVHPAVELLLARMETHPDEFKVGGMWSRIFEPFKCHWNNEEKNRVKAKLREIHMGVMHEVLMKKLVEEPQPKVKTQRFTPGLLSKSVTSYNSQLQAAMQASQEQASAQLLNQLYGSGSGIELVGTGTPDQKGFLF